MHVWIIKIALNPQVADEYSPHLQDFLIPFLIDCKYV